MQYRIQVWQTDDTCRKWRWLLWRWLRQDVLYNHSLAYDLSALRGSVADFLDQFSPGSDDLLHYCGLLPK